MSLFAKMDLCQYAEPHIRGCERTVNTKIGGKCLLLVFTSYFKLFANHCYPQQKSTMSCAVKIRRNMLNG